MNSPPQLICTFVKTANKSFFGCYNCQKDLTFQFVIWAPSIQKKDNIDITFYILFIALIFLYQNLNFSMNFHSKSVLNLEEKKFGYLMVWNWFFKDKSKIVVLKRETNSIGKFEAILSSETILLQRFQRWN